MTFDKHKITPEGAKLEYVAIRDEIMTRLRLRHSLLAVTVGLAGAFLAVGLQVQGIGLVFAPLAAFLALAWAQNDLRIRSNGWYLRHVIEPILGGQWESYMNERRFQGGLGGWKRTVTAHLGLLIATQLAATFAGVFRFDKSTASESSQVSTFGAVSFTDTLNAAEISILTLDIASILFVVYLAVRASKIKPIINSSLYDPSNTAAS